MTSDVHLQIPSSSPDSYVPCSINSSNYVSISTWAIYKKEDTWRRSWHTYQ